MPRRIFDPITLNLTSTPQEIPLPEVTEDLATLTLLVRSATAVFDVVDDTTQTQGVKCPVVGATDAAFSLGSYVAKGLRLYAVTGTTATVTIVPVRNPLP